MRRDLLNKIVPLGTDCKIKVREQKENLKTD